MGSRGRRRAAAGCANVQAAQRDISIIRVEILVDDLQALVGIQGVVGTAVDPRTSTGQSEGLHGGDIALEDFLGKI